LVHLSKYPANRAGKGIDAGFRLAGWATFPVPVVDPYSAASGRVSSVNIAPAVAY
jgi:hypothetical protein